MKVWLRIVDADDELLFAPIKPPLWLSNYMRDGIPHFRYKSIRPRALRDGVIARLMFVGLDGVPLPPGSQPNEAAYIGEWTIKGETFVISSSDLLIPQTSEAPEASKANGWIDLEALEETVDHLRRRG